MAKGLVSIDVSFPKLKGLKENDLLLLADKIVRDRLHGAVEVIRKRWYQLVTRRSGDSGAEWDVVPKAVLSYLIENRATTKKGEFYAGYVHRAGQKTTLVNTMVRRVLARTRKLITEDLLSLRATGKLPSTGAGKPSFRQATKDALLSSFADAFLGV